MSSNGGINFTGLASGLNTKALIQNVLRFDQQRISTLQSNVATEQTQQTAFQGVQSDLQTLQTASSQLGQSQGSVFDSMTVASSNSNVVTAAAGTGAQPGITNLQVLSLAQANQIASQGYSDPNSTITQGTFQIQSGTHSANITIDSTNNTLSGLAQAINNSKIGVTATIVNTGEGGAANQPYRLLLTSSNTGTANAIKVTNNLAADSNGAVQPNFSSSVIGPAVTGSSFSGTASVTANSGAGNYTGSSNDTYTFTVQSGGTVGTTNNIQVAYTNSSGSETGTLTLNAADLNVAKNVADGVQVTFGSGTLNPGDQFTVNVFSPTIQAASNAQVQIGSGVGAIVVQNSTNTLTNVVPGVTLSLKSAAPGQNIQLNVSNDVSSISNAITNFVNDYNKFASDMATATAYTPGTGTNPGTAGPLNGNTSLIDIQNQLEQKILSVAPNLPATINRLSVLGITPNSAGQLQINTSTLNNALNGGISGVSVDDIKNLFTTQGQSSSAGVQFSTGTGKTLPSGANPYTVNVTQAATQAAITSTNPLAASTVIDSTNNTLSLNIDGASSGSITLPSGTYTQLALANAVQKAINASVSTSGASVTASVNNNHLVLSSNVYGAQSKITGLSGSALSSLGYTGSETSTGTDVQGSFTVNGVTEAATGVGQILTGNASNANTSGLTVVVTYTPTQIASGGTSSTLTVTQGLASSLTNTLQSLLDPVNGQVTAIGSQITKQISSAQQDITTETAAMNAQQSALMSQFAAMETVMANLQQTSTLLSAALASTNSSSSNSSSASSAVSSAPNFANASISTGSSS